MNNALQLGKITNIMTSYSKEECIEAIREANKKTEGKLSKREYNKFRDGPVSSRFYSRDDFDGWNDAKKQAGLYVSKPGGKLNANYSYFNEIDTSEKAYWLGMLMGDGSIYENQSGNMMLAFTLETTDGYLVEAFKEAIEAEHKVSTNNSSDSIKKQFRITDEKLTSDLITHGVTPDKTTNGRLPDLSEEMWIPFARGLFDADGCIRETNINQSNKDFTAYISGQEDRLRGLAEKLPFDGNIRKVSRADDDIQRTSETYKWIVARTPELRKMSFRLYPDSGNTYPKMERKWEKMQEAQKKQRTGRGWQ